MDTMLTDLVTAVDAYIAASKPIAEWPSTGLPPMTAEQRKALDAARLGEHAAVRRLIEAWGRGWRPEQPHRDMGGWVYVRLEDGRALRVTCTWDAYQLLRRDDRFVTHVCTGDAYDHVIGDRATTGSAAKTYTVTVPSSGYEGGIAWQGLAADEEAAIDAHVADLGYSSREACAEALGMTLDAWRASVEVVEGTVESQATIYVCDAEGGATIREADADDLRAARDADAHTGTYEDPRTGDTVTLDAEMDSAGRYILPEAE